MKQQGPSGSTILGAQKQVTQWRHENITMRWYQNQPPNNNNNISIKSFLPTEWANIDVTALCKQWIGPDHPQENDVLHCRLARYKNCFGLVYDNVSPQGYRPRMPSSFTCPLCSIFKKNSRCRIKLFNLFMFAVICHDFVMVLIWAHLLLIHSPGGLWGGNNLHR